jgi:hypothetical protein
MKKIIGMYFGTKSYLKSNYYDTAKHPQDELKKKYEMKKFSD